MRLAYDFTSAVKSEPSGIARYATELLRSILRRLGPDDRVTLGYRLSRWRRRRHAPRFDDPRVRVRPLQSPLAFLTYGGPDVFHGLGVNVPLGLPRSTRTFVTIHGFVTLDEVKEDQRVARAKRLAKIQRMLARADRAFVVSRHELERTAELCDCDPSKLRVVHHGVDHAMYRPADDPERDRAAVEACFARAGIPWTGRPFVLALGAITHVKNTPNLLRAFARSRAAGELDLVLAGQRRSESEGILASVKEGGGKASVRVLGHVPPEEVPHLLRQARCLVHASVYESFGLPIIEAMACGTPVLCSNTAAMPEIAGGAAVHFAPKDPESIAAALDAVAFDEGLRSHLTEAGLARARTFTWDRAAAETLATYSEVLSGRTGGAVVGA